MKKIKMVTLALMTLTVFTLPNALKAQGDESLKNDSKEAKAEFIKTDESMKALFDNAYGYVIFPKVTKAALIVGGAGAKGVVYEQGKPIGEGKMAQGTVGPQIGGKEYREVIFFENKAALDRFKENKIEFSGQVSAVAAKSGAAATAKYTDGVSVFTQERGGLMLEASLGGQKFTYNAW